MHTIPANSGIRIRPGIELCQSDLPLDWYLEDVRPYAEEYLALPDRAPETDRLRVSGCGCATMSRNDPPHLAGLLDLLRRGSPPDINRVHPGDMVDELSAARDRLSMSERAELIRDARFAMRRMIDITERNAPTS